MLGSPLYRAESVSVEGVKYIKYHGLTTAQKRTQEDKIPALLLLIIIIVFFFFFSLLYAEIEIMLTLDVMSREKNNHSRL